MVKNTWETVYALKELHGRDVRVACIGHAGENLVRFAFTMVDKHSLAARGSRAVWGPKCLKAPAVRGHFKTVLSRPEELNQGSRSCSHGHLDLVYFVILLYLLSIGLKWQVYAKGSAHCLFTGHGDFTPMFLGY